MIESSRQRILHTLNSRYLYGRVVRSFPAIPLNPDTFLRFTMAEQPAKYVFEKMLTFTSVS